MSKRSQYRVSLLDLLQQDEVWQPQDHNREAVLLAELTPEHRTNILDWLRVRTDEFEYAAWLRAQATDEQPAAWRLEDTPLVRRLVELSEDDARRNEA